MSGPCSLWPQFPHEDGRPGPADLWGPAGSQPPACWWTSAPSGERASSHGPPQRWHWVSGVGGCTYLPAGLPWEQAQEVGTRATCPRFSHTLSLPGPFQKLLKLVPGPQKHDLCTRLCVPRASESPSYGLREAAGGWGRRRQQLVRVGCGLRVEP